MPGEQRVYLPQRNSIEKIHRHIPGIVWRLLGLSGQRNNESQLAQLFLLADWVVSGRLDVRGHYSLEEKTKDH